MKKGFTLIELLIVIGVLAILATAVVLVLNPAEKLKQARDSQRINDLRAVKDAIGLYRVRVSNPVICASNPVWRATLPAVDGATQPFENSGTGGVTNSYQYGGAGEAPSNVNGTGWVPIDFSSINSAPFSKLPIDPVNDVPLGPNPAILAGPIDTNVGFFPGAYIYAYQCSGTQYEINANMESQQFGYGGARDVESSDGGEKARADTAIDPIDNSICDTLFGVSPCSVTYIADRIYEVGDRLGLDL